MSDKFRIMFRQGPHAVGQVFYEYRESFSYHGDGTMATDGES